MIDASAPPISSLAPMSLTYVKRELGHSRAEQCRDPTFFEQHARTIISFDIKEPLQKILVSEFSN